MAVGVFDEMNLANTHPSLHSETYITGLGSYHTKSLIYQRFACTKNMHI